jgi:hypothetical protein
LLLRFPKLTRTELANTICELFSWKRPTGKLKTVECRQFLERLEAKGIVELPACNIQYARQIKSCIEKTGRTDCRPTLSVKLNELSPLLLNKGPGLFPKGSSGMSTWIDTIILATESPLARSYVILSYPESIRPSWGVCNFPVRPGGCLPGINGSVGMMRSARGTCKKVISNSRFLIFPWVQVKNLASSVLSLAAKTIPGDWYACYGCRPVLMETLVDQKRYAGTCYKAANWVFVGGNHR